MNVALCLHGQPRFFEQTYKYFFSRMIESLNCDVYFHTWWSEKMVGTTYSSRAKSVLTDEDMLVKEDIPERLITLFRPKDYQFDDYDMLKSEFSKPNCFQYYSQYAVSQILQKRYDLIIRSRFDLMCTQGIEFVLDDNVWVPSCCPYTDGRVNDMFSFSNHENFLKLSSTFLNLPAFEEQGKGEMEWALASQIEKEKLSVRKFDASYDTFDILRSETAKKYML